MPSAGMAASTAIRELPPRFLWLVWGIVMVVFSASPVVNHLRDGVNNNKDYYIWYEAGQKILHDQAIYPQQTGVDFEFLYPPCTATFLAPLTIAGKLPFVLALELITCLSWVVAVLAGVWLAGVRKEDQPFVAAGALLLTSPYAWDNFLLGQPNLFLLACILGAVVLLRREQKLAAGTLLGFAAAFKAFPVMAIVYLVWRRHWSAAAAMLISLLAFLFLVPIPLRGWEQNLHDLKTWTSGMLFRYDSNTIAQRPSITYGWKNQSLVGTSHRLLRDVSADHLPDADGLPPLVPVPVFANIADLEFSSVNVVIVAIGLLLCLTYVGLMPRGRSRSPATDAVEWGMLLIMMTIFSPISWFYYGIWLLFPYILVLGFAASPQRTIAERRIALVWLAVCLLLCNFVYSWEWIRPLRAVGWAFFGYVLLFAELGWILSRLQGNSRFAMAWQACRSWMRAGHSQPEMLPASITSRSPIVSIGPDRVQTT